jgi:hypothetical protein
MTQYKMIRDGTLWSTSMPPDSTQNILLASDLLLPPLITDLHRSLRAWSTAGYTPGFIDPARVFINGAGIVAFAFADTESPARLPQNIGAAPDLAGWLILLDKWMETFVVVARARHVWTPAELSAALPFISPVYQPTTLIELAPVNWARVGRAVAEAVADGPLKGSEEGEGPENKHWQKKQARTRKAKPAVGQGPSADAAAEPATPLEPTDASETEAEE